MSKLNIPGGGKKLPSIISAKEKALDAQVKAFRKDKPTEFDDEIRKLDTWYRQRHHYLKYYFRRLHQREDASYAEAKMLFKDFYIPCSNFFLHAVCRVMDPKNKRRINFKKTKRLLKCDPPKYNISNVNTLQVTDSYYYVHLKFIPLLNDTALPCHFEVLIRADMYIGKLSEIIEERTGLISKNWQIFTSPQKPSHLALPVYFTLQQLRVDSGSQDRPGVMILYYNGALEFMECPLLQCDHYCYYATNSRRVQRRIQKDEDCHLIEDTEANLILQERERMWNRRKKKVETIASFNEVVEMELLERPKKFF